MDIGKLSISELRKLQKKVDLELKKRDDSAKRELLKKMQRMAAEHGMSIADVVGKPGPAEAPAAKPRAKPAPKSSKAKIVVAPKYRNPDDAAMTWTGRGRKPLWVQKCLDEGKTLEALQIN